MNQLSINIYLHLQVIIYIYNFKMLWNLEGETYQCEMRVLMDWNVIGYNFSQMKNWSLWLSSHLKFLKSLEDEAL